MDSLICCVNTAFRCSQICKDDIENVNGIINEQMSLCGTVVLELRGNKFVLLRLSSDGSIEEGFMLNRDRVLEIRGRNEIVTVNGTIDKESGIRYEGSVFEDTPFGFGSLFDENGNKIYEGMVMNWERVGYGVSINGSGLKEYEGYWCDSLRCGSGKLFDNMGNIVFCGNWINGEREDEWCYVYQGNGSKINIRVIALALTERCILNNFDDSLFTRLEQLYIGDDCFENVDTFRIDGLNNLKSIEIGCNSFTKEKRGFGQDPSRSFHILNCGELKLIDIGRFSFSDYAGEFELKNLPSLVVIRIGIIESDISDLHSNNFYYSSFKIQDLPGLQYVLLGGAAFYGSLSTVISNIPNLETVVLGQFALAGRNEDSCSLEMKDLPKLTDFISERNSLYSPRTVILSNIPNVTNVDIPGSFKRVTNRIIGENVSSNLLRCISMPVVKRNKSIRLTLRQSLR